MAWPTTTGNLPANNVLTLDGDVSYARLGTDELLTAATTYVILDAKQRPLQDIDPYENGDGIRSGRVRRVHGVVWDLTIRDRTDVNPPKIGQTWTIVDMAGLMGVSASTYSAKVMEPSYDVAAGKPGQRVVSFEHLHLVEGAGATGPVSTATR